MVLVVVVVVVAVVVVAVLVVVVVVMVHNTVIDFQYIGSETCRVSISDNSQQFPHVCIQIKTFTLKQMEGWVVLVVVFIIIVVVVHVVLVLNAIGGGSIINKKCLQKEDWS